MSEGDDGDDHLGGLMRAAQDGDRAAYRRLLAEIAPRVRRAVSRRFAFLSRADVEDVVQDVLLSVHTARATYDPARPFEPWLMAIARNRTTDMARRHIRQGQRELSVAEYPETSADDGTHTEESLVDADALQHAMANLPEGQRTAIELVKLREMSLKEASAVSGMSIGALKAATHRATRALRAALGVKDTAL